MTLQQSQFMAKSETVSFKGILVCMVLISHLSARVSIFSTSLLGTLFSAFGYLAVSFFFFLSGFGLYERYIQSGAAYIKTFFEKRILPYYAMCCFVILIYLVRDLLLSGTANWTVLLQSFFFGETIVDMGWYLQAQLLLYILFFLVFRFAKRHQILWITALTALYCLACAAAGLSTTWYEAVLCFPLGMLCARKKTAILRQAGSPKKTVLQLLLLVPVFLLVLLLGNKQILPEPLRICVKMVSCVCFAGLVLLAAAHIKTENPVTVFLGKFSLEIYVLQGLFLYGLRPVIHNDWLYIAAVLAGVILLALAAHPVFQRIHKGVAGIQWKRKKTVKE